MPTRLIFIGLGSNQGDRAGHLGRAIEALHGRGLGTLLISSLYRTDPVEVIDQEEFLNQVVGCETALSPEQILEVCLLVEQSMGRQRTRDKGPRRPIECSTTRHAFRIRSGETSVTQPTT